MGGNLDSPPRARAFALAAVGLLLLPVGLPIGMAGAERQATAAAFSLETIGGRSWSTDIRVTNNAVLDEKPQLYTDANNSVHFLWPQTVGSATAYRHAIHDVRGFPVLGDSYVTGYYVPGWGALYPWGPTVGLDSHGDVHVTFDDGWQNVYYAKYNGTGTELVAPRIVGPNDASASHTPTLAVGVDDTVHIAHEDYKYMCEDVFYNRLDVNGTDQILGRVVSADYSTQKEFMVVKVDRFGSGNVVFSWGSGVGSGVGRMNRNGVQDMASVLYRTLADYRIGDLDLTPDGSIHVVWQDTAALKYTRINSTGVKVVDAVVLSGYAATNGFPRVVGTQSGDAILTWSDTRSGRPQVMYAVVGPSDNVSLVPQVQLTNSAGNARDPWATVDGRGRILIGWSDDRDGNLEIYYKQTYECMVNLQGGAAALRSMVFWRLNETRSVALTLSNGGYLEDEFSLDLNLSANASAAGWQAWLDASSPVSVEGEGQATVTLTVRSPPAPQDGDTMELSLRAAAVNLGNCSRPLTLAGVVNVRRALTLDASPIATWADNGDTVSFGLVATNRGELPEDAVDVRWGGPLAQPGWAVLSNVTRLSLQPNESRAIGLSITVPSDLREAPAFMTASFGVEIRAEDAPEVQALKALQVSVKPTFGLDVSLGPPLQYAEPGGTARFDFLVNTSGNYGSATPISIGGGMQGAPGWSAAPEASTVYLSGGQQARVPWLVSVPLNATSGTRATLTATANATAVGLGGSASAAVEILPVCGMRVVHLPMEAAVEGGPVRFNATFVNDGNFRTFPTATVTAKPPGWNARFLSGLQPATAFIVDAFADATAVLEVTPQQSALAGDYVVSVRFDAGACGAWEATAVLAVPSATDISFLARETTAYAPLAGDATFALTVGNHGNLPTAVDLTVAPLPSGFVPMLKRIGPDGVTDFTPLLSGPLHLEPGEEVAVRLHVWIPVSTSLDPIPVSITARSSEGLTTTLGLTVRVLRADLRVAQIQRDRAEATEGDTVRFAVTMANVGQAPSAPGACAVYLDGEFLYSQPFPELAPGENLTFEFAWVASKGPHTLRANATSASTVEADRTNNDFSATLDVAAQQQTVSTAPAEPTPWVVYLVLATELGILALVCVYPRKKSEEELEAAARREAAKGKAAAQGTGNPPPAPAPQAPAPPASPPSRSSPTVASQPKVATKAASPKAAPKALDAGALKAPPKPPVAKP